MIDGRLLVPASTAWLASATTLVVLARLPTSVDRQVWSVRVLILVLLIAVAFVVLLLLLRARLARWVVVAVAGLLLGGSVAAMHVHSLSPQPVSPWVDGRVTATVLGVVTGEPVLRTQSRAAVWQQPSHLEVRLATSRVSARGQTVDLDIPLLLRLPADARPPPPGSSVQVTGRLSAVPGNVQVAGSLTANPEQLVVLAEPGWVDATAHAMRVGLRAALVGVPPRAGALVAGLAVGDESLQSAELDEQMRASGLSHLTAVSGGNVSIVVVLVVWLVTLLRRGLAARVVSALAALAFFVVLVGPAPSVLRAAAMGGLVLIGMLAGGRRAGPSVLAASVLLLLVLAPGLAASWGLALSAFATAGLILLAPRVHDRLDQWPVSRRWPPAVREAASITLAAQLATAPLLIAMGASVGWVSVPANLLAMPVVAPITVLGLLSAAIAPLSLPVATALAHAAAWPAGWIALVAQVASGLPLARLPWPEGLWGVVAIASVLVGALLLRVVVRRAYPQGLPPTLVRVALGLTFCVVALWALAPPDRRGWPPPGWFVLMCDVGQGDAVVVRSGEHSAVVVDAGPDPDAVRRCLDDAGIETVPAVVLTHFHADHVGGLEGILKGRDVGAVFVTPIRDPPEEAARVDAVLRDHGLVASPITAGDVRTVAAVTWRALWPRRLITSGSVPNNASIVLVVRVDGHDVLLSGDIEPEAQAAISTDLVPYDFDVVKVPHHGSRYQHPLLTTWAPAPVALISVGAGNTYGHPSPDTITDWTAHGALVGRTDLQGDLAVVDEGSGLGVAARHGMLPSS